MAVLSDVHGNTPALRAVLDDVAQRDVDLIVDLGDVASGGVDPRGTLDLLRSRPDVATVRGNHERQLLERPPAQMTAADRLAHAVLTDADRGWLTQLPTALEPCPGVLAFHGSPTDDLQYLLHSVDAHGLRTATDDEVRVGLGRLGAAYDVLLCGHTHLQGTRRLDGRTLVVNPGSVGWPAFVDDQPRPHVVEAGSPHARYSILERRPDAAGWDVEQRAVDYPVEEAAALAEANGRLDVAHALRSGRVGSVPGMAAPHRLAGGDSP